MNSPNVDNNSSQYRASLDPGIYQLFDKYLKSNDNYLPLKAYLESVEYENYDEFSLISNVKLVSSDSSSLPPPPVNPSVPSGRLNAPTPFTTSLNLFKKHPTNELQICQKLYKIVISIDYAPSTTSLDYIQKSLEIVFEKIAREYEEFYEKCYATEPQIYVTCLLWNMAYFYTPRYSAANVVVDENLTPNLQCHNLAPFTIIAHSKRLLKSNINDMARFLFAKINEAKTSIIESALNSGFNSESNFMRFNSVFEGEYEHRRGSNVGGIGGNHHHRSKSPFDEFLRIIMRIFDYFCINEVNTSQYAPTALACSHHIHITDGVINATDITRCVDKLSRTAITYSFIYSGCDNWITGSNISSSFGHLADYSLMKFIAYTTGGFYMSVDDNLVAHTILNQRLFYYYSISTSQSQAQLQSQPQPQPVDVKPAPTSPPEESSKCGGGQQVPPTNSYFNSCDENEIDESRDYFNREFNSIKFSDKISSMNSRNSKRMRKASHKDASVRVNEPGSDIWQLLYADLALNDQMFEFKCIQSYELAQRASNANLLQLFRVRAQEGFYLVRISHDPIKSNASQKGVSSSSKSSQSPSKKSSSLKPSNNYVRITLYFKKYFTQTLTIIYKVSYVIARATPKSENPTTTATTVSNDPPSGDSGEQVSITPTKSSRTQAQQSGGLSNKLNVEIWLSWNFLHLRARYQNLDLMKRAKTFLNNIHSAEAESSLELTQAMLNPPEILKDPRIKEPLFKELTSNTIVEDEAMMFNESFEMASAQQQHPESIIKHSPVSIYNLKFELNSCLAKMVEKDFFHEFANAWKYLAFFKFNKSVQNRLFCSHSIRLVLDHDRPMPDMNQVLFDLKNTMMLQMLEQQQQQQQIQQQIQMNQEANDAMSLSVGVGNRYSVDYLTTNLNIATSGNNQEQVIININHSSLQNSIFSCVNSMNRLRTMLTEWCDVVLVENCVFVKFLVSSVKYNRRKLVEMENSKKQTQSSQADKTNTSGVEMMSTVSEHPNSGSYTSETSIGGGGVGGDNKQSEMASSPSSTSAMAANDAATNIATASSNSPATPSNTSTGTPTKSGVPSTNTTAANNANNSANTTTTSLTSSHSKNSFVMIKLDYQYVPFVSLQFLFHSNISYMDRTRIVEKFKSKINEFKCVPPLIINNNSSMAASPNLPSVATANSLLLTPTSSIYSNVQSAAAVFAHRPSNVINLSFDENQQLQQTQRNLNSSSIQSAKMDINKEFCHLLHKPELYDAFRYALLEDVSGNIFTRQQENLLGEIGGHGLFHPGSKSINFMHQKRYRWKLNKQFSFNTAQTLKETIIDTLVRTRLKEGFKCLFRKPKLVVFTLQLTMFDSGDVSTEPTTTCSNAASGCAMPKSSSSANLANSATAAPSKQPDSASSAKQVRGSSQICTFIYVIRFANNVNLDSLSQNYDYNNGNNASKLGNRQGLLNIASGANPSMMTSSSEGSSGVRAPEEEVYFQTEIYCEAIDGIFQERKSAVSSIYLSGKRIKEKSAIDYFKSLNTLEICNLIYLIDLKCFSALQSIYSLFLSKSNSILNLNSLMLTMSSMNTGSSSDAVPKLEKSGLLSDFSTDVINNILAFNVNFVDSVRLLPDVTLVLKKHSLKESRHNSSGSFKPRFGSTNLHHRIRFNQPKGLSTTPGNELNSSNPEVSPISSSLEEQQQKEAAAAAKKPKKPEILGLQEQLRPLLNSLDIWSKPHINIDFDFTLRGILLESALYVVVFEDIPFNLWSTTNKQASTSTAAHLAAVKKIQQYFLASINEQFKHLDPTDFGASSTATPMHQYYQMQHQHFYQYHAAGRSHATQPTGGASSHHYSQQSSEEQAKTYDGLVESMKSDVKNAIALKLNDIKSGDSIVKQIIDHLKKTAPNDQTQEANNRKRTTSVNESPLEDESQDFKVYIKFQVVQSTAKQNLISPSSAASGVGGSTTTTSGVGTTASGTQSTNTGGQPYTKPDLFRHTSTSSANTFIQHAADIDSNKFFVYGLFFLNTGGADTSSNRLVFFLFNCMPEHIKNSLIQTQTNTYLIRKFLFPSSSSSSMAPSSSRVDFTAAPSSKSSASSNQDPYKFYPSKNSRRSMNYGSGSSKNLIKKAFSISDILLRNDLFGPSLSSNLNDSYLLALLNRIEERCARFYIKSLIHYLATCSIGKMAVRLAGGEDEKNKSEDEQAECFDKRSINQLLKMGTKIKLTDLDLTEYFRLICVHLNQNQTTPQSCKEEQTDANSSLEYLERKFEEIFLKRFHVLPGFNDLFVFTSLMKMARDRSIEGHHRQSEDTPIVTTTSANTDLDEEDEENLLDDGGNSDELDSDHFENFSSETDSSSNFEEDALSVGGGGNGSSGAGATSTGVADSESELSSVPTTGYYDESDSNEPQAKLVATSRTSKSSKLRRLKNLKSSSPYSSATSVLNRMRTKLSRDDFGGITGTSSLNEKIIGLEMVCVINNEQIDFADLDMSESRTRTRTTTLTADNISLDYFQIDNIGIAGQSESSGGAPLISSGPTPSSQQQRKFTFTSKFNKFNCACIFDLIEEKDMAEFSSILAKIEAQANSSSIGDATNTSQQHHLFNDIKIYLRFNWYSFNDLTVSSSNMPFGMPSSTSKQAAQVSKPLLFAASSSQQVNQSSNYPFVRPPSENSNSNSSLLYLATSIGQSTKLPTPNNTLSTHSSTSTVYNQPNASSSIQSLNNNKQRQSHLNQMLNQKFEYNHILSPSLREFKWHLRDEIFQMQKRELKNMKSFYKHMEHIRRGCTFLTTSTVNHKCCHIERKKIVLSRTTVTTTTSLLDAPPKTNASKLPGVAKQKKTQIFEEDSTIISVDMVKFFSELAQLVRELETRLFNSKLQQMNQHGNDLFYYLRCNYDAADDLAFKIMIHVKCETLKTIPQKTSPSSSQMGPPSLQSQTSITGANDTTILSRSPATYLHPSNAAARKPSIQQTEITKPGSQQIPQAHHPPQLHKPTQVTQEIITNQLKIKIYFGGFNHSGFESKSGLVDQIINEFNVEFENIIRLSYLKLALKEIHENRKWNNLLQLKESVPQETSAANSGPATDLAGCNLDSSITSLDNTFSSTGGLSSAGLNKQDTESMGTLKNMAVLNQSPPSSSSSSHPLLVCNCVWSTVFKLHRLHQTLQKVHDPISNPNLLNVGAGPASSQINTTIASTTTSNQPAAQLAAQQYISQGLNKLRESLVNFRIEESSNCGDLYVYTNKKQIYLLKLEEIYDTSSSGGNAMGMTPNALSTSQQNQSLLTTVSSSSMLIDNDNETTSLDLNERAMQRQGKLTGGGGVGLSRRPSHASISDAYNDVTLTSSTNKYPSKSQNLSGGVVQATASLTNAVANQASQPPRNNPEYIRLSVYGLQEPDDEMKNTLCRTLQAELDYWLLIRMCNSIEKNTYKTTSAQHPDKITDEDLVFFKQICDNYFEYELPLPFVFNFNRTLRENFFYFVKQMFNANFKSIDAPPAYNLPGYVVKRSNSETKSTPADRSEEITVGSDSQSNAAVLTQQLSYSLMSSQPTTVSFDSTARPMSRVASTASTIAGSRKQSSLQQVINEQQQDPFSILLTRIFFHNSKHNRIGKHNVTLVLVEALYSIKGLDYLVSSKITRSNSIGAAGVIGYSASQQAPLRSGSLTGSNQTQILETSRTRCRQIGPTFVFRFYCRGESSEFTAYKNALKSALNDALLLFLSEYMTRVDASLYMKRIDLKKKPPAFRVIQNYAKQTSEIGPTTVTTTTTTGDTVSSSSRDATAAFQQQLIDDDERMKLRKRHKSTGHVAYTSDSRSSSAVSTCVLKMNKSALKTRLGRLLLSQNIRDENQLNAFIFANFSKNLFDHKDYEDTLEYFRESIRPFEYSRIVNQIVSNRVSVMSSSIGELFHRIGSVSDEELTGDAAHSDSDRSSCSSGAEEDEESIVQGETGTTTTSTGPTITTTDEQLSSASNSSSTSSLSSLLVQGSVAAEAAAAGKQDTAPTTESSSNVVTATKKKSTTPSRLYRKSHLRIIYEWLKGLYYIQSRGSVNICSKSTGSMQTLIGTSSFSNIIQRVPSSTYLSSQTSNPGQTPQTQQQQQQQQHQPQQSPNPALSSLLSITQTPSFILRKQFNFYSKYNLINFLRDLENSLRDFIKTDINACYFTFKKSGVVGGVSRQATTTDEVFDDEHLFLRQQQKDTPLSLKPNWNDLQFADEFDHDFDFANLKRTRFNLLHDALSRSENLVVTINAEYNPVIVAPSNLASSNSTVASSGLGSSMSQPIPSSTTATAAQSTSTGASYNRVPSFGSARDKEQQSQKLELATSNNSLSTSTSNTAAMVTPNASQQQQQQQQIMIKSMTSTSGGTGGVGGDLESSISSQQQQQQLQTPPPPQSLKRTFCYILVNAKSRKVTFYCFTTEPACYDSIKQFLDQSAELIAQRHTLVNNIVLYKLGGLIGDCLMYDIKKVKQSAMSGGSSICNSSDLTSSLESPNSDFKFIKPTPQQIIVQQQQQQASALKMSKSPTMLRQLSLGKGLANINPNIITSLQFSSSNSPQSGANSSSTATSCQTTTTGTTVQTPALQSQQSQQLSANSIRQLFLSNFNDKFYDSIVNIINQQALFCSLYLSATLTSTSTASSSLTQSLLQQQQSLELPSNQPLTLSFNAANTIHRQTTQMAQLTSSNNNLSTSTIFNPSRASFLLPTGVNMTSLQQTALGLYGVGLCYQLYEMQQIYRHPRKIYEIAISLGSCQQTSGAGQARGSIAGGTLSGSQGVAGSTPTTSIPVIKSQMPTVNEFYKNFVQPVLVPFHYCCTPLLFYPNWHDTMVTENMLRVTGTTFVKPKSSSDSSSSTTASSSTAKTAGSGATSSDSWYYKMRQIILVEYARYFEARGFIRLKDEPKPTAASSSNRMQQQQQQHSATNNLENQTFHFIRWIQQDGFLYITMNIEEIYLCVKLGYCTRYRSTSRLAFMNEMIRFFTHEFHLHSFIYDVHLAAINTNFLNSVLVPQIAPIISKFLDEFVEFFDRIPAYSSNKVYKLIHEKRDSSLIPHQFSLIFDLLIDSRKKMAAAAAASNNNDLELNVNLSSSLTLKILFLFGNSIAIYSLIDNTKPSSEQQSSKFLVIKIESFTKETTTTINQTAGLSTTPSFNSPSTMENSVIMGSSRQPSERQFLRSSHRLTTSSSSSSLPVTPEQQNVYGRKKVSNPVTTQTPVKKLEPFIRVTCYYIYINKNPTVGLSSGAHQSATSSSLGSSNLVNAISSDLEYINKVIEESINAYKMEIFWDNLTSSMYSIKSMLNDDKPSSSASSPTSPPISFEVNSDELEQILNISQKINILELDPSLDSLMNSCYLIRDKIKDHLAPAFGRHYIFTQSNTVEYAILLINDELIRNFRHNEATNEKPNESSNEQKQLKSFILLEFDRQAKTSRLLQVNRVKTDRQQESRQPPKRSTTVDAIASSIAASTASSNLPSTSDQTMASSLKSESQIAGPSSILSPTFVVSSSSTLNNRPIHRYLSFTVNFLICVLWESLFSNT